MRPVRSPRLCPGTHEIEVVIRLNLERGQHLIEHGAVLRSDADANVKGSGLAAEVRDHGTELYSFRSGSENEKRLQHFRLGIGLTMAEGDAALGQIIGGKFQGYSIASQNADAVTTQATRKVGKDNTILFKLHTEKPAGKFFEDRACYFNTVFFTQSFILAYSLTDRTKRFATWPGCPVVFG